MNGTIYDFTGLPRLAAPRPDALLWPASGSARLAPATGAHGLVGLVSNPRSHRNSTLRFAAEPRADMLTAAPRTRAELRDVLRHFADEGVDLLVIDGGDGTVRDVLTCSGDVWEGRWPTVAVLPSGKTNALAIDLGLPKGWTLDRAIAAARAGRVVTRSPVEIERRDRPGDAPVRGFLFGAGAFVAATELAQRTHRAGAFNGVAVGLALSWALARTFFGPVGGEWRRGEPMRLRHHPRSVPMHGAVLASDGPHYLLLASTLEKLPLGVRPFGAVRPGLKTLAIDAPPRHAVAAAAALLGGSEAAWLERSGHHRVDTPSFDLDLTGGFILDGEVFPAGEYRVSEGAPLRFVTP